MRATTIILGLVLASMVALIDGCSVARPLHRSKASIRMSLLKRTPPGVSKEEVEAFIKKEGWHLIKDYEPGLGTFNEATQEGGGPRVSEQAHDILWTEFGSYTIFFGTREVFGVWAFDSKDRLIDVWVVKENDVL